jgi:hypothetical protein
MDSSNENVGNSSFGREILKAAGIRRPANVTKQGQASSSDSSDSESAVLGDMDDFLDEALGSDSDSEPSPSPAKKTKDNRQSPQVHKSSSAHVELSIRSSVCVIYVTILPFNTNSYNITI